MDVFSTSGKNKLKNVCGDITDDQWDESNMKE